jgi:hypothetical protein
VSGEGLVLWVPSGNIDNKDGSVWTATIAQYCVGGSSDLPSSVVPGSMSCTNISNVISPCHALLENFVDEAEGNAPLQVDSAYIARPGTLDTVLLDVTGVEAITDWVLVEIRDASNETEVLSYATAAVKRNGDIVSEDGDDVIIFPDLREGLYYVAVHHRNHHPLMTDVPLFLSTENVPVVDFADPSQEIFGGDVGAREVGAKRQMWAGDLDGDGKVIFQGPYNDVFALFSRILIEEENEDHLANFIIDGYEMEDINMDGLVIYQGPGNDRAPLLQNTTLAHPQNTLFLANFIVYSTLP